MSEFNPHDQQMPKSLRHQLIQPNGRFNYSWLAKTAFTVLKRSFWPLFQACLAVFFIVVGGALLLVSVFPVSALTNMPPQQQVVIDIVSVLIFAPLTTGLSVMGINAIRGNTINSAQVLRYFPHVLVLALAQLLISVLTQLGFALLIIPGLYILMATTFTLPLIADKNMGMLAALKQSVTAVNQYLLSFIVLFGVFLVLFLVSIASFGLALLIVMPFYFVVMGIIYSALFDDHPSQDNLSKPQELMFDA
ncbi:hypothetical protein [Alteromonas sp. C1M14]|uniref:hypothetical protein n=1 Tax=Alteromonas sp. C1M14 TaxID=2841567 RepID=UPI001C099ADE|nr:hypothetical protein [Alteromonas sp. C1M14]MBU2976849.1 hypothetical protein [Alteromonas sp. C1M14]